MTDSRPTNRPTRSGVCTVLWLFGSIAVAFLAYYYAHHWSLIINIQQTETTILIWNAGDICTPSRNIGSDEFNFHGVRRDLGMDRRALHSEAVIACPEQRERIILRRLQVYRYRLFTNLRLVDFLRSLAQTLYIFLRSKLGDKTLYIAYGMNLHI